MKKGQAIIEVVSGVEGPSLYIGDEDGGHRLAGPKPWGGGQTVHKFVVDIAELQEEAARFEKQKQKHDYDVTHNEDGTFSVALPDGEELRIVLPQRTWEGLSVFEINDLVENTEYEDYRNLVERTEAKLKEKNA